MNYRDTCPKQVITKVHHTIATWLPVTLSCGHVERINWTAKEGERIGCTQCADDNDLGGPRTHVNEKLDLAERSIVSALLEPLCSVTDQPSTSCGCNNCKGD